MSRNTLGAIIAVVFLVGLGVVVLFNLQGLNAPASAPLAQAPDTPVRPAATSTPVVVEPRLQTPTPVPTWLDTVPTETPDPLRSPTPTPPFVDAFRTAIPRTPAPTPNLHATTVPELDRIAFVNLRPLPASDDPLEGFGNSFTWAPDNKHYLGEWVNKELVWIGDAGYGSTSLYLGNAETGELALWQSNAGQAAWSRDGQTIYYLALRVEDQTLHFDLYRRPLRSPQSQLLARDMGVGSCYHEAALETATGGLLTLDGNRQPGQLRVNDRGAQFAPLAAHLIDRPVENRSGPYAFFALAPDGRTAAMGSTDKLSLLITDLATDKILVELAGKAGYAHNLAWSRNSRRLLYAIPAGVFIHDLDRQQTQAVVTGKELGFLENDWRSGFSDVFWSPDEQVVLYHAKTGDWVYDENRGSTYYLFAATRDGSQRKTLSRDVILAMSPDKSRAIIRRWEPDAGKSKLYLVDVIWR